MPIIVTTLPGTGRAFDDEDEARDYTLALDRCGIEYTIKFPTEERPRSRAEDASEETLLLVLDIVRRMDSMQAVEVSEEELAEIEEFFPAIASKVRAA
jgi:hypothetical protein